MPGDSKQRKESPNGEDEESSNPNATEQSSDDDSKKNLKKPDEKKHNSGAADLEKVTDYAEEKEITSTSTELTDAIANIRKSQQSNWSTFAITNNTINFPIWFMGPISEHLQTHHWFWKFISAIGTKQAAASAEKLAREKELAKVSIKNEDVDLIVQELEIPKAKAERTLREYQGNIVEAMASLTN